MGVCKVSNDYLSFRLSVVARISSADVLFLSLGNDSKWIIFLYCNWCGNFLSVDTISDI